MKIFSFSAPSDAQITKSVSRIVAVFLIAFFGYLSLTSDAASSSVLHGAALAGLTAVYQFLESLFTTV